ncbi:EAL domain-containing protein [Methylomonas sp. MgM2]
MSVTVTILIVDDNPENLTVLNKILLPVYRVLAANSGQRALRLAMSDPKPDLILLDVMMPEMDGYTVLAKLKANPVTSDIPVIFVTAMDSCEDERRGLELGAADYITKPVRPDIVLARVRTRLELKRARDRLRDQNAFLEAEVARRVAENELIMTSAGEGIYGTDTRGLINFINPAALNALGYTRDELLGRDTSIMLFNPAEEINPKLLEQCFLHRCLAGELSIERDEETFWRKDGTPFPVEMTCVPLRHRDKLMGAVVTFTDITERKTYMAQLERKSNFDDLTGLPNRNLLTDRLSRGITLCRTERIPLTVLVLSLGRFREINEGLGRAYGDKVLQEVALRLEKLVKESESVARLGGDKFVLLLENDGSLTGREHPVLASLSRPFLINGQETFLSPSIGISIFPKDGEDGETLLKNAEAAMYKARAAGGSRFHFYSAEMNTRSLERLTLENELRRAQEKDELRLVYQPQLNLRSGEIIGAEALIRWQHPRLGLVSPADFIPLAEAIGLIVPIGEWVLRTACAQNKAWQDAGLPNVTMAVNLSAHQFVGQNISALVETVLNETGLDPGFLELELTESAAMYDVDDFVLITQKLKALGVTLSIDDFGTGYSSLSYLKRFAIDRLKIDKSFVDEITQDPNNAAIAQAVTALSHSLNLSVIAEGVETEGQLKMLSAQGCDEMQGFYFSKPVSAAEFELMLREGRRLVFPPGYDLSERIVLLVDDEANILSSLKRLLRREGYIVLTACSGQQGLELMATHKVGVVISDARMPHMTGADFLSKVRQMHPDCVRIMLSGYTDIQAVTEAVNKGEIYKFLTKPWDSDDLRETVRKAFLYKEVRR